MTAVVADTDVVSLTFKRHSLSGKYLDAIEGKNVVLSFMTLAELELWTQFERLALREIRGASTTHQRKGAYGRTYST